MHPYKVLLKAVGLFGIPCDAENRLPHTLCTHTTFSEPLGTPRLLGTIFLVILLSLNVRPYVRTLVRTSTRTYRHCSYVENNGLHMTSWYVYANVRSPMRIDCNKPFTFVSNINKPLYILNVIFLFCCFVLFCCSPVTFFRSCF